MAKRDKAPKIMVEKTMRGLSPCAQYDAEMLDVFQVGQVFELGIRAKKPSSRFSTYWLALDRAVKATDSWPTKEHLHDELKMVSGYFSWSMDLETGKMRKVPDSIAFGKMTAEEFKEYFNVAMAKLSEAVGFDPLQFLEDRK